MKATIFKIQGVDSIQEVQNHFSSLFPCLQISFFRDPNKGYPSDQCIMFSPSVRMMDINPSIHVLPIEITPKMQVTDLEDVIKSYGLHAQISCQITNSKISESSVAGWYLSDLYKLDEPILFDNAERIYRLPSKWDDVLM